MRTDSDIEAAIAADGDAVWRVCRMRAPSAADAQDAFQETFLSYATTETVFEDAGHRRGWLLRVATNRCVDLVRSARPTCELEEARCRLDAMAGASPVLSEQPDAALWEVSQAFDALAPEQREALYLTVCEGYPATEASRILNVPVNTVYSWVARGKQHLKEALS